MAEGARTPNKEVRLTLLIQHRRYLAMGLPVLLDVSLRRR